MKKSKVIALADQIVAILRGVECADAIKAMQIAKILIPSSAIEKKKLKQKKAAKQAAEQEKEEAGALEPADTALMEYAKAMNGPRPQAKKSEDDDVPELM